MSETKQDKWERGKTLMLESLHKPDDRLRGCAHNQECFHELLEIRDEVLEIVRNMPILIVHQLKYHLVRRMTMWNPQLLLLMVR